MASSVESVGLRNQPAKPRMITLRRVLIILFGTVLPLILMVFGSYLVSTHTKDDKLAMWLILHSHTMTDQQLADAIGEDPFAVLRRSSLMMKSIDPAVAILIGILVGCVEKQTHGRMVALILTPFFLWDFSMSAFSTLRTPAKTVLEIVEVLGTNTAYIGVAALVAIAIARFLTSRNLLEPLSL